MPAKLYTPVKLPGARNLGLRVLFVLGLLAAVVVVIYFEKGHRDSRTGEAPDFLSCIYFAFVTVTTVGYGDIVPVTQTARLVDALFLTPIRFIVILIFVGTAYQLALKRLQEEYRMKRVVSKLTGHIVVCGFGTTGRAVVQELLLQGEIARQIVVIDEDEKRLAAATQLGVIGVLGDASQETVLKSVAIERAEHVIICPGRDDTAVLIALTTQDLNPQANIIAATRESENEKLLRRSGAHTIITPSSAGGALLAAATRHKRLVETLLELVTVSGEIFIDEREVMESETGKHPRELRGIVVVRVYRDGQHFDAKRLPRLQAKDTIVFVAVPEAPNHEAKTEA